MGTNLTENWPIKISQWPRNSAFLSLWLVLSPAKRPLQPVKDTNMIPYISRTIFKTTDFRLQCLKLHRRSMRSSRAHESRHSACVWVCMHIWTRLQPADNGIKNLSYSYGDEIGQFKCHKMCFHTADDKSFYTPSVFLWFPIWKVRTAADFYTTGEKSPASPLVTIVTAMLKLTVTKGCC